MKKFIPQKLKNIYHLANAVLANLWLGFPSKKIKVIGVTGTNGKTTTVQMVGKILEEAGKKTAVASTINFKIGDEQWVNKTKFTTLNAWQVQKFIRRSVSAGCEYLVLEVSSHSLDQNRIWGIRFDVVAITNVTREHLDYHKTMEEYRAAKLKLFWLMKEGGTAVVNLGMENPEQFLDAWEGKKMGYRIQRSKIKDQSYNSKLKIVRAEGIKHVNKNTSFEVNGQCFEIKLPGEFNIENALAAICIGLSQDITLPQIAKALEKIKTIPGRMDRVENNKGIEIVIDYAVTPDSMEKLGSYVKKSESEDRNSKILWVFGSCGERDRGKRPIMGEIVAKYADLAIVTNEDPYGEDPQKIIDEVFAGVLKGGKEEHVDAFRIFDRKQAIKKALSEAQSGDVVLVTGKGAEETMAVGNQRIPWNDRQVVEELLGQIPPKKQSA